MKHSEVGKIKKSMTDDDDEEDEEENKGEKEFDKGGSGLWRKRKRRVRG